MPYGNTEATLCWYCKNACGGCPWSGIDEKKAPKFEPVKGWKAKKTKLLVIDRGKRYITSYIVKECPLFEPDGRSKPEEIKRNRRPRGSKTNLTAEDVMEIRAEYMPHDKFFGMNALAKKYNVSPSTIYNIIARNTWRDVK